MRLRRARRKDVGALLALINGYADRGLLLRRTEESLRARLEDFTVAVTDGEVVGCGALTELGPGLGEVRSLAVREDQAGNGLGRRIVDRLLEDAGERGFAEVLALTRRVSFFEALGFEVTRRERFLDKLVADCKACPLNLCCDETAMVRAPMVKVRTASGGTQEGALQGLRPRAASEPNSLRRASGGAQGGATQGLRPRAASEPNSLRRASGGAQGGATQHPPAQDEAWMTEGAARK